MNNDPIIYTSEEQGVVPNRPQAANRGLAGFLVGKGWVSTNAQANAVLVIISIVLLVGAVIIPFIW